MADEWLANTDGIGKFLKSCYEYWKKAEPLRLDALAEVEDRSRNLLPRRRHSNRQVGMTMPAGGW